MNVFRIHMKQNLNMLLKNVKKGLKNLKDLKAFIEYPKILKSISQTENILIVLMM